MLALQFSDHVLIGATLSGNGLRSFIFESARLLHLLNCGVLPSLLDSLHVSRKYAVNAINFVALAVEIRMSGCYKWFLCLCVEEKSIKVLKTPFGQVLE